MNLSLVTSALMKLLKDNINNVIDTGANVSITPEAPDKVGTVVNTLSLYMYHVTEEAYYKNFEGPGGDAGRSIARAPMGLCLFYVLTAHHESGLLPETDPLTQQRLMGYALKTMHDYPIIVDSTKVGVDTILPVGLIGGDNPVQVIMRPTAPEDAVAFWGAEDSQAARLSAYYEVRVILLEPDEPTTAVAPVLSLGTYLYQLGAPHLEASRSELGFALPASSGGTTQIVTASPARVSTDTGATPIHNQVVLTGQNLAGGKSRQVWLGSEHFPSPTVGPLPIDLELAANQLAGWSISVSTDEVVLEMGDTLSYINSTGVELQTAIRPGIYTAFLRVTVQERMIGATLVPITNDSNLITLAVIPRIASDVVDAIDPHITLTFVDTFDLTNSDLAIQLLADGQVYLESEVSPPPQGYYYIDNANDITFHATFDTNAAGDHAVRLIVNGAESAPYWVETP